MPRVKNSVDDLAIFGGDPIFVKPKSTSNLATPNFSAFLDYSRLFYREKQYTNNGPCNRLLEERLARFHDVDHCITFSSGFWALALTIQKLALPSKNKIIMPSLTYRRMADIASWAGLEPVFCEVNPTSLAMDADTTAACIDTDTAIILGAHPIVNCCDVHGIEQVARENRIPLVFDSVESVFECYEGRRIGSFGNAEAFSMHACKLINGFGGGYITTNDESLAKDLAAARGFGFVGIDTVGVTNGMNAKLNEMHAAMALASLDEVTNQVELNQERFLAYQSGLATITGIELIEFNPDQRPGYKNIVAHISSTWPFSRDETVQILNAEKVLSRAYYDPPLHKRLPNHLQHQKNTKLATTERLSKQYLNLPCGQQVTTDDIFTIIELLTFIHHHAELIKIKLSKCVI